MDRIKGPNSVMIVVFFFLIMVSLSGCTGFTGNQGSTGYIAQLDNRQMGISLSSDSPFRDKLCDSILNYINVHTKIKACGPQIIGEINPKSIFYSHLHNDLNLDYLLLLNINHINFGEIQYKENPGDKDYSLITQVQYQCTLSLAYQLIDLKQWRVITTWQGEGKAVASRDIQQGNTGLDEQQFDLVNQAMYNGIFKSGLLSFNRVLK